MTKTAMIITFTDNTIKPVRVNADIAASAQESVEHCFDIIIVITETAEMRIVVPTKAIRRIFHS